MGRSTREVEVKLPFRSVAAAREGLLRIGATVRVPRRFEDNVVFDRHDGSVRARGIVLRVRSVGERTVLTLKTPVAGAHRHKVRDEHETTVADRDALIAVLRGLGYEPWWRYQKYRTVYTLGNLEACLDETPIGCFVELEGPPDEIDRSAEALGFGEDRYVRETYRDLCEREAARRGKAPSDLLMPRTADAT